MSKFLQYSGQFASAAGSVYEVEIWKEADTAFGSVGELTFDGDEPLVIEWPETGKEEPLQGSTATLKVISPADRTYIDLYTVQPANVVMKVRRNGSLYWCGALDPEFYEEPYERIDNYTVSLTFSDFGAMSRQKITQTGLVSIRTLINTALTAAAIDCQLDESLISTELTETNKPLSLDDLLIDTENLYDDGERLTASEAITEALQPLALRMIQRNGTIFIYDLNGLWQAGSETGAEDPNTTPQHRATAIRWAGDSQTLSADLTYNNLTITCTPNPASGNIAPADCWTIKTDDNAVSFGSAEHDGSGTEAKKTDGSGNVAYYTTYHASTEKLQWADATDTGFTLWTSRTGINASLKDTAHTQNPEKDIHFYKIVPQYSGQESEGIEIFHTCADTAYSDSGSKMILNFHGRKPSELIGTAQSAGKALFASSVMQLPPVADTEQALLKVSVNMLLDPRTNPFESAVNWMDGAKEKWYQEKINERDNFTYVPVMIKFQAYGSSSVLCWDNRIYVKTALPAKLRNLSSTFGEWKTYTETDGLPDTWGYLAWYDGSDREKRSGIANGFALNRPAINPHTGYISTQLKNATGQYIPYPDTAGGYMWIEVCESGWFSQDDNYTIETSGTTAEMNRYVTWSDHKPDASDGLGRFRIRHILMELPKVEIVENNAQLSPPDDDDIEYTAVINMQAEENLDIDTIIGTGEDMPPTARGSFFNAATRKPIKELTRAGRTAAAEELLIGTLYSQYAERHAKIEGRADITAHSWRAYTEPNQSGKLFVIVADTQYPAEDAANVVICELSADNYDKAAD